LSRRIGRIILSSMVDLRPKKQPSRTPLSMAQVHAFIDELYGSDMHAARVRSLASCTVGVLEAAELGIHAIGRGLAAVEGLVDKHAVKQVDRCIGNEKLDVGVLTAQWTRRALAEVDEAWVNLDWTEFDKDGHSMLVLSLQTGHGRSMPLMWKTVKKDEGALKGRRNAHEDALLDAFARCVPPLLRVVIVADRGFGDQSLFQFLDDIGFDYIIRIRSNIVVADSKGQARPALGWVGKGGRMRRLRQALVTTDETPVGQFVAVQDKDMKDAWLLVASDSDWSGAVIKRRYGKRFSCEETFRDLKDLRFGLGMKWRRVSKPERRDRLMLLSVLAMGLLTELGAAGEDAGLDRLLKTNTSKKRTMSLFRQGLRWFVLLPNMPEERLLTLMTAFDARLRDDSLFRALVTSTAETRG
jgi:hypothetical protein